MLPGNAAKIYASEILLIFELGFLLIGCGRIFQAPNGEIHSPNYPSPYRGNTDCSWVIRVERNHRILLNFTDFDLEPQDSCITAYDGLSSTTTRLASVCGRQQLTNPITSSGNSLFLRFQSGPSRQGRGFRAQFNQVCGGHILTNSFDTISSPLFPAKYPNNQNCSWVIQAQPPFNHITLSFDHFGLESSTTCTQDFLEILDGDYDDAPLRGRYCGTSMPHPITSFSSALTLRFVSDSRVNSDGFHATYAASSSACGGTFHMAEGIFNSPGYPEVYPSNVECVWNIVSSPGNRLQLSFITFQLEDSQDCSRDFVEVREGTGKGLTAVPEGLSAFTQALDISMNNITQLPEDAFKNFPFLEELRLAGNDLSFIHPKALSGLKELKVLTLQNNQLKTVPSEAIRGLSALQSLRLDANHITSVPEDSFEGLAQLRHLWLDDNSLMEVPVHPLSNLPTLQALTLALNKISSIPDYAFTNLSSLVVLHLHNNKIKNLGQHCFDGLDNLETLDLNYNNLGEFPQAIKALPSLKELLFHSNSISVIPDGAFDGNPLLRTIHLYDNPLSFVGNSAFHNLSDLHSLVIRGASMVQQFPNLTGTVHLESLTLTGTKISSISSNLCQEQKMLRTLDLSYNSIKDLPSFDGCHALEEISLQRNQIHQIKEGTFQGLVSLRILDLSRNQIHEIHNRAFAKLGSITNLDISFNELTSFPTEGLSGLNQLKLVGNLKLKEALAAKDFVNLRSLSVPYAYQCCAFWGCDSYAHSNTEDTSLQDHSVAKEKGPTDVAGVTSSAENEEHSQIIIHCTPSTGAFKPCEYLLGSWMIRLTVWFIFLVALSFNLLVIITTFASCSSLPSSKLFIGLISVSNLFMGAYTGILTFLDAVSWGRFAEFGIWWEIGSGCRIAGFLAIFSSESAIFLLMLAAVERSLSVKDMMKNGKSNHLKQFRIAALFAFLGAAAAGCFPLFHRGEYSASPLCLPFPTGETPSLGFTVTLVLLNSLAFLLMAIIYTKLYCNLEKEDLSENSHSSMIKHVAWLIFTNCIFFCPVAFFSFAPLITAISISPEIMKSVTLIFFPLPACLNPVLYVFFNPKFKEDWKLLKRHITKKSGSVSVSISSQAGCVDQDFYYDCGMYSHLQGNLTVCDCCESFLLTKPVSCKHLIKSHSCPALAVGSCQRPDSYWSDCGTQSAHSDYADEEDSFVSDSSDQVQACGRACFYQSRGFPLVRYAYNLPRVKD